MNLFKFIGFKFKGFRYSCLDSEFLDDFDECYDNNFLELADFSDSSDSCDDF